MNIVTIKKLLFSTAFLLLNVGDLVAHAFPLVPPQNFVLNPQYIAVHHPVQTEKILAQLYFDQGLTFIYAFNHDAAFWSFLRASEVDPTMSMAYWGMALSLGPNINMEMSSDIGEKAYEIVQKAVKLSENAPENEKMYIQALAQRYTNDSNASAKQLAIRYSQAMQKLTEKYPEDPDAAVLYAESLLDVNPWNQWSMDGKKPLEGTLDAIDALEGVLKKIPEHLGANHYYIHAIEASDHPERALVSADRLKTLLPSSGHILHMPSHIYLLVGDYAQAVSSNIAAVAADRAYIREYGIEGIYPLHYLSHNLYFLSRSYTMEGRFGDAKQAADDLTAFYVSSFNKMEDLEYYASAPLTVLISFHRWKDILQMEPPSQDMKVTTALWRYGRSLAFSNLGELSKALEEQRLFFESRKNIKEDFAFGYNRASQILDIANDSLTAKLAEKQGKMNEAIASLKHAIDIQDRLRYNEPPDWFYPTRIALGALLFRIQNFQEAETIFREELRRHPRNGWALFGLKESLKAQSKFVDHYWVNEEFEKAWQNSSINLNMNDL